MAHPRALGPLPGARALIRFPGRVREGSFSLYLDEIGRHRLLDIDEERALAARARRGDREAVDRLVSANLRFVVAVAKRYRGRGVPMEDLVTEGNLALLKAAERYDGERGVRFVGYASRWVRQAMLDAVARATWKGEASPPSPRAPRRPTFLSLDGPSRGDGSALAERLAAPGTEGDRPLQARAVREALETGLALLPGREERVLRLYFGLDDSPSRSLAEIAGELGVSRERVRQLKDRALARLREGPCRRALEELSG